MTSRHIARSVVLQTLFERDFSGLSNEVTLSRLSNNIKEFSPGLTETVFATKLLQGILDKQKDIDNIIEKAAPEWPLDRISPVDRNALRIGLFELLFSDRNEVPPKVAINEAIELSKTFGGERSGKFVNGVLGTVYKELGEPDKDAPKRKSVQPDNDSKNVMSVKKLVGAVVFAKDKEDIYLALVHDVFGRWTLSKGKLAEGEKEEDGVKRVIKEEIGLDIVVSQSLGVNEYIANDPNEGKIKKRVAYFLVESQFSNIKLVSSGGLDDARWFKLPDILSLNFYPDTLNIITKAINLLLNKNN